MKKSRLSNENDGSRITDVIHNAIGYLKGYNAHSNILHDIFQDETNSFSTCEEEQIVRPNMFNDMPVNIQLKILSYLDVSSLCSASQVCQSWSQLANDQHLWVTKLRLDSLNWEIVDRSSHPSYYHTICPKLTAKEIYCYCRSRQSENQLMSMSLNFTKIRYHFGLYVPRIVLFGSGLDSSGLVRRILWEASSPFKVEGMFPGQFEGMGSGVSLSYQNGTFNFITLYALSKAEREGEGRKETQSKLLVEGNELENASVTISQPVKQLCSTIDGFIYVVDSSNEEGVMFRVEELKAMIDDKWLQSTARLLVLCVVPNSDVTSVPSLKVADQLNMLGMTRMWQVRQCQVNSLHGFIPGMKWVTGHICSW